jgi:hypothetical protein
MFLKGEEETEAARPIITDITTIPKNYAFFIHNSK